MYCSNWPFLIGITNHTGHTYLGNRKLPPPQKKTHVSVILWKLTKWNLRRATFLKEHWCPGGQKQKWFKNTVWKCTEINTKTVYLIKRFLRIFWSASNTAKIIQMCLLVLWWTASGGGTESMALYMRLERVRQRHLKKIV